VKFLVDNSLSPRVAESLRQAGNDSIHVRDLNLQTARDSEIFQIALNDKRIVISADTDFGTLFVLSPSTLPSVILFRGDVTRYPQRQAKLLIANIPSLQEDLLRGSVIVISKERIRIRPFSRESLS